ncbi:MBL fold metallo-hydrolase [Salinadaptatus halalkaliphilus]|uniref:MBL fold metallo-hydrolase n=1 Tax=Salinadaptatus halalkaliphilus TaxID=2419781 RepID=A0A4S3TM90_9EURY|nr:MBL fold metallo-hydrolase [Salinadaptatus halalkaliphilus]THE65302.1 MBL fold metallo-hydrolase [Salinadaptatus halalkaliphilus]
MNATDDWYDIEQVADRTYHIDEAGGYGMVLFEGEDRSVVVDAGAGVGDLYGLTTELVETPVTMVLSHTHWDHIGAASQFDDVLVGQPELPADGRVAVDTLTDEFEDAAAAFLRRWLEAGYDLPDGFDPDGYELESFEATPAPVEEGIDIGDRTLELYPLPGHAPGQIGVLDPATGVLYGGDVLHVDRDLYVMFEGGDLEAYVDTFATLVDLRDAGAFDTLLTSHNEPITGDDLAVLEKLRDGVREILEGDREYEIADTKWGDVRSYPIGETNVLTPIDR